MKTLLAKLLGVTQALLSFYLPILRQLLATGISTLLPYALDIVRALAESDKTGAQKREAAVRQLRSAATDFGLNASESLIRLTVESAVQKLKLEGEA